MVDNFDYQIMFFKRNVKTSYGGYWAHPGGLIEEQDYAENWKKNYPEFKYSYHDLSLRICCLRELFEE